MKVEKEKRKRLRLLNRGFKAIPPPEEGEEQAIDEEIENDPEEFDKEAHEKELIKMAFPSDPVVIDGTWNGFPEETVLAVDGAGYANLLFESRRAPEVVIVLKCKEENSFKRLIDEESTKKKYDELIAKRDEEYRVKREADRKEKVMEVLLGLIPEEEKKEDDDKQTPEDLLARLDDEKKGEFNTAMKEWDDARDTEDEDNKENDPEKPDLEAMMTEQKEKITAQREADEGFLEEFKTTL
jgi:hypothetical protein